MNQYQIINQCSDEAIKKFDLQCKDKGELFLLINETFHKKKSKTAKEKYETLLLRDKILKLVRYEINQCTSINPIELHLGTCLDMCPERERFAREHLSLCHKYEYSSESDHPDHFLMIKEYSRSSADQDLPLPNEMRPLEVLYDTMLYIIDEIISKIEMFSSESEFNVNQEFSICEWYDFVWNRTRSIRKDIIQQRLLITETNPNIDGVLIIEQCARFHIMCSHRLCDQPPEVFDLKINEENLKNCFQSLRQYYENSHSLGSSLPESPNESEFRSYIILLNLTESNILSEIQRWPKKIRHSKYVQFALNCYFAFNSRNYVRFFRLVASDDCEYLQACILHRHFYKVRSDAFKAIFRSFKENKEKVFPIASLIDFLGFDNMDEIMMYANMYGLDKTEDELSFRMLGDTNFDLSKSDLDSLKQRSKILVENKFYLNHFYSGDLNNRDRLSVIISGLNITDVKSSRFLSPENELTSSFDHEGNFLSDEIDSYLEQFRQVKSRQSLKPLTNNKQVIKPALDLKKPIFEALKRERKKSNEEIDDEQASKKIQSENLFSQVANKSKPSNLFESLIKKPQVFHQKQPQFSLPVPILVPSAQIHVDINKIAEDMQNEILDQVIKKMSTEIYKTYSKYLIESSDTFFEMIIKENLRHYLVEEILDQQNIKYKNEALNRISVNLGDQILSECVLSLYTEYLEDLQLYERFVYDEILRCVFQKEFDIILKQIASEISADMILDQLADKVYLDEETGIFNEDLLLALHDTIFDTTRLNFNVNNELYQEIKSCLNENLKHIFLKKWRLKLSLKLLHKQNRKSMNQTIGFMLKYASFLSKNIYKLSNLKSKIYETVHSQEFLKHLSMIKIDHRYVFLNILLENYFSIINDDTQKIYVDIPNPVQEVLIKTVLYTTRPEVYMKFFPLGQTELYENLTINLLNPREFCVKFCLKKYQTYQDLDKANSIIFTIENFEAKNFDYKNLSSIKHIMFISFYSREKTINFIEKILSPEQTYLLCCPEEDKDFFTIDKLYESFMREVIADRSNRAPNLLPISLRDLFYETLIKFLDHTQSLIIDQIIEEFSIRFSKLISILLNKQNLWSPIKEFLNEESLKFWSSESMFDLLRNLSSLFKNDYKNQNAEYFRAFVEFLIENEKVKLGDQMYTFDSLFVYADMDLVRSIDWVEKEELSRKYNLINLKRRISNEKIVKAILEVKEEKSPKRFMMINEKMEDKIQEKLKTIDSNFDSFLREINKEKENGTKFDAVLIDIVRDEEKKQSGLNGVESESSFDSFMRKLNDEKTCNEKFNEKLNQILWKY